MERRRRNTMEINYEVTEEDYIKFNIYHAKDSGSHKRAYNIMKYWISILCGAVIFFVGPSLYKQPKIYWGIIAIIFILIWIIRFPKTYKKLIKKITYTKHNKNPAHNTILKLS